MSANTPTDINALRQNNVATREAYMPDVSPSFGSLAGFELMQRQAKLFASSTLVPVAYQAIAVKLDYKGNVVSSIPNPSAVANCMIALNIATRMHADPLAVMQNLYIVEGRPSWSSQWIIAAINNCGRFSPLRFEVTDLGIKECTYTTYKWDDATRAKVPTVQKVKVQNIRCVAWVVEKGAVDEAGKPVKLTSSPITIEMAVNEGWYTKNGSKWQTMPDQMLRYRAASMFGKVYAPELLMGIPATEEAEDIAASQRVEQGADGTYAPVEPAAGAPKADLRSEPAVETTPLSALRKTTDKAEATDVTAKPAVQEPQTQEEEAAEKSDSGPAATQTDSGALFGNVE